MYSGEEFSGQKLEVAKLIAEKESLIVSVDSLHIDMEEILEYCFSHPELGSNMA